MYGSAMTGRMSTALCAGKVGTPSCSVGISPPVRPREGMVKLYSPLKGISLVCWQLGCLNGLLWGRDAPNAGTKLSSLNGPLHRASLGVGHSKV